MRDLSNYRIPRRLRNLYTPKENQNITAAIFASQALTFMAVSLGDRDSASFCAATGFLSDANGVSNPSREGIHVPVNCPAEHVDRVPEQRYHPVAVDLENAFRV
jgi:hypothetical protein